MPIDYQAYLNSGLLEDEEEANTPSLPELDTTPPEPAVDPVTPPTEPSEIDYQSYLTEKSEPIDYESYLKDGDAPEGLPDSISDPKDHLPKNLTVGLPIKSLLGVGTDITAELPISISEDVSAFIVGAGHAASLVPRGIKQWLGVDEEQMAQDEQLMDQLYADEEVGGVATAGMVTGAVLEPVGFLLPGAKAATIGKTVLKAGAISGAYGALSYVKPTEEETFTEAKLKQVATYTAIGGAAGAVFGGPLTKGLGKLKDIVKSKMPKEVQKETIKAYRRGREKLGVSSDADVFIAADKQMDDLDYIWAKKVTENPTADPATIKKMVKDEFPEKLEGLWDATKVTGRAPHFKMQSDEALDILNFYEKTAKPGSIKAFGDDLVGLLSTRVGNHSKRVLGHLQKFEKESKQAEKIALDKVDSFMHTADKMFGKGGLISKRSPEYNDFAVNILNGDFAAVRKMMISKGVKANSPEIKQMTQLQNFLEEQGVLLKKHGILKSKMMRENFFPRAVKDLEGFKKHLGKAKSTEIEKTLRDANAKSMQKLGRRLTISEEATIVNNSLVKFPSGIGTKGGKYAKARTIDTIDHDMLQFYDDPLKSLHSYVRNSTQDIQKAKLFGKNANYTSHNGIKYLNNEQSIGNMLQEELKAGNINYSNVEELHKLLNVRFGIGEQAPNKIVQGFRNILYTATLANPISAAVQFGDVAVSMYVNGLMPTIKAIVPAAKTTLFAKPGKMKGVVKDLGLLGQVSEELVDIGKTAHILNKSMQYSGFTRVDAFGKEVALKAAMNHGMKAVKSEKGLQKFLAKHKATFGDDTSKIVQDLKDGVASEEVKLYLFSELSRMQPISKLELPAKYLNSPDARFMYMLKSFMLKQVDLVRRDAIQKMKNPKTAPDGLKNLLGIGIALGAGGTASSVIQEFLKGNDKAIQDIDPYEFVTNMTKTFGWSEYTINKAASGKPMEAAASIVLPPYALFDKMISKDGYKYTPVVGKITHYWFGEGLQKEMDRKRKQAQKGRGSRDKRNTTKSSSRNTRSTRSSSVY